MRDICYKATPSLALSHDKVASFERFIMRYHPQPDFLLELQGYRLTTAEILYHLPDYPQFLQTFIWQNLDLSPDFPRLHAFLRFWQVNLEGQLFSVRVTQMEGMGRSRLRFAKEELNFH